jgi:hypothetical protein
VQTIDLPSFLHPVQKVREIRQLAGKLSLGRLMPGKTRIFTRSGLVKLAKESEHAIDRSLEIASEY